MLYGFYDWWWLLFLSIFDWGDIGYGVRGCSGCVWLLVYTGLFGVLGVLVRVRGCWLVAAPPRRPMPLRAPAGPPRPPDARHNDEPPPQQARVGSRRIRSGDRWLCIRCSEGVSV